MYKYSKPVQRHSSAAAHESKAKGIDDHRPEAVVQRRQQQVINSTVVQPKFSPTEEFTEIDKVDRAYRLFLSAVPDRGPVAFVRDAEFIDVEFRMANLSGANGNTSVNVDLGEFATYYDRAPSKLPGGIDDLHNKRTQIDVALNKKFVEENSPGVIAKTLAHELGTHVAPHVQLFRDAFSDEGVSEEQIDEFSRKKARDGAQEHLDIRNRRNLEYERIVKNIAVQLGGPGNKEAREVVYRYVADISRYDERGERIRTDQSKVEQQFRGHFGEGGSMEWARPYLAGSSGKSSASLSTQAKLWLALGISLTLIAIYLSMHSKVTGENVQPPNL